MPYKREGKTILTKSSGQWKVKQRCSSIANAEKALRLLRGIEHEALKPKKR